MFNNSIFNRKYVNVIAIDISGSTSGCSHYYQNAKKILDHFYNDSFIIIEWNGNANTTTMKDMVQIINNRRGEGWTGPSSIIKHLSNLSMIKINHFILITDGQVETNEIDNCDKKIKSKSMTFQRFDGYIIGESYYTNMSVIYPFTRSYSHTVTQIKQGTEPEKIVEFFR